MTSTPTKVSDLVLTRRFDASPERVFDAWISQQWGEWMPPKQATGRVIEIEPRTGGSYEVAMTMPDGREVGAKGRYEIVDRPRHLVFTWLGSYNPAETRIDLRFEPDGNGTLMTLTQSGFGEDETRTGYESGWGGHGGSFDKLAAALAEGRF